VRGLAVIVSCRHVELLTCFVGVDMLTCNFSNVAMMLAATRLRSADCAIT
jgi:hypothetical protein